MKLKTLGLVLIATAFTGTTALAMDPIPNPPEKAKTMHHKKHHHMKKDADAAADKAEAAKPAMPAKK